MAASPALTIELRRDAAWVAGVAVLAAGAAAATLVWLWAVPASPTTAGVAAAALLAIGAAVGCAFVAPGRLRWDGRAWYHAPRSGTEREGEVTVMVDVGGWMLLQWRDPHAPTWRRATWLPVPRRGLESQWNALRAAVYSPRPASGDPAAADSATASE